MLFSRVPGRLRRAEVGRHRGAGIGRYDLGELAAGLEASRGPRDPRTLDRWALMEALLDAHLASSDSEALGGEIAARYGLEDSLAGLAAGNVAETLAAPGLGTRAQPLAVFSGIEQQRLG